MDPTTGGRASVNNRPLAMRAERELIAESLHDFTLRPRSALLPFFGSVVWRRDERQRREVSLS